MITIGVDIGSASSKAVIMKDGKEIITKSVVSSGTGMSGRKRVFDAVFKQSSLGWNDIDFCVATGYGRFSVEEANREISEITCHARGVSFLHPGARTIIDIGGQDAKAISLNDRGGIKEFFMNDKCAAGTGRFLENVSRILEVGLEDMESCHFKAEKPVVVSSTCVVFSESEIISLLSQDANRNDIIAGIHQSIAVRACALAGRTGILDDVVLCGGVMRNGGVVDAIRKKLGRAAAVAPDPQTTGALGAALLAYETARKQEAFQ